MISQGTSGAPGFYIGHDPSHNFRFGDQFMSTGIAFPNDNAMHYCVDLGCIGISLLYRR
jgi:hypothetical protein